MRRKDRGHGGKESPAGKVVSAAKKQVSSRTFRENSSSVPESLEALRRFPRAHLLTLARRAGLRGRSRLNKEELVLALGATLEIPPEEKAIPPSPTLRDREDLPLPEAYGIDRLVLLPVDPYWVHAYWELAASAAPEPLGRSKATGDDTRCILRVYDVTSIYFDGTNAHGYFDIQTSGEARNWYINLCSPGKTLCAELGLVRPDGSFSPVVRSNVIHTPPAQPSTNTGERWIRVEWRRADQVSPRDHPPSEAGEAAPRPGQLLRLSSDTGKIGPVSRSKRTVRAKEYRRFLEVTHRVKILQPDEPAPPGPGVPAVADGDGLFQPGLSSFHWVRKPDHAD